MKTEAMAATQVQEEVGERKEEEDKTTTPKKEKEEEGDECPICLDEVSLLSNNKYKRFTCCGKVLHNHCSTDLMSMEVGRNCPFCRAKSPTSHEEAVKYIRPWVKKKKAWAQALMCEKNFYGTGVKQSYEMARIMYEQAAQQGSVDAMYSLGTMYYNDQGVEQSYEKAFEYLQQAADLGFAQAQFNLGGMYNNGDGVEKDIAKTREWWTKAAAQGHANAIKNLKILEKNMK
jgi:hypothetical protein